MAFARGKRAARVGILASALLAVCKLVAGIVGNSYALIADAIESSADVVSSAIVLGGLQVAGRDPDDEYPFGYGKAETLSSAVVALMLVGAAIAIAVTAVREIRTPHHTPAWWTLAVLVVVMAVKTLLSRRVCVASTTFAAGPPAHHPAPTARLGRRPPVPQTFRRTRWPPTSSGCS
jgi:cation diffusion facilitator family transporter